MVITLKEHFKSLAPFVSEELGGLTVITGKNGSGKTQLLTLLSRYTRGSSDSTKSILDIHPDISSIQSEGIEKKSNPIVEYEIHKSAVRNKYNNFAQIQPEIIKLHEYVTDKNIAIQNASSAEIVLSNEVMPLLERLILQPVYIEYLNSHRNTINGLDSRVRGRLTPMDDKQKKIMFASSNIFREVYSKQTKEAITIARKIADYSQKNIYEITESDYYKTPIESSYLEDNNLFNLQLENIFYNYANRREQNMQSLFRKKERGEMNNSISSFEFNKNFPAPWDTINNIFDEYKINFFFKGLDEKEFHPDSRIKFDLIKKDTNQIIELSDLSSGELIIIGLIIKLFISDFYSNNLIFPNLLILDEPDAHLHPEMSKLLLDILHDTFATKFGIKVIITTHSPSTVAITPENCLYQLINGSNTSLKKISKDNALKLLTSFIPTLSIDYKNHRQVFVESPTDATYFQSIYDKHSNSLHHQLYFICNAMGKGNSDLVISTTNAVKESGITTTFGIIDWDLKNKNKDSVFVHGINERYNVENFVLDPIYVMCLLMEINSMSNTNPSQVSESIGLGKNYNIYKIGEENDEKLQEIIKYFFSKIEEKNRSLKYGTDLTEVYYFNNKKLSIPTWYLQYQGHDLVDRVQCSFDALAKFKGEGVLQAALSRVAAKCYPFVPKPTIEILETIGTKRNPTEVR